jgi:hypothetical protein
VEWLGLVLLAALVLAALVWAVGLRPPGLSLASAIAKRLICAVRLTENCASDPRLEGAHGDELAALLQAHAPTLLYEDGMHALPVDFRRCREDGCAYRTGDGAVAGSDEGRPVVAYTHAIDCRPAALAATVAAGADCSGERAGNLYLQYWLYYPGSATAEGSTFLKGAIRTASSAIGHPTYHPDDWESYQVRIGPDGRFARASSHHGYSYELAGPIPGYELRTRADGTILIHHMPETAKGWGPEVGVIYISGGSHAGTSGERRVVARTTKDHRLTLIPLRWIALHALEEFAVTPPWEKRVYRDPEYGGTD